MDKVEYSTPVSSACHQWLVFRIKTTEEFEMLVFNRWGEKVYQTTDKNANWSGEFKQSKFGSSNVYFWILTYKGWDNITYRDNGTLTIVK